MQRDADCCMLTVHTREKTDLSQLRSRNLFQIMFCFGLNRIVWTTFVMLSDGLHKYWATDQSLTTVFILHHSSFTFLGIWLFQKCIIWCTSKCIKLVRFSPTFAYSSIICPHLTLTKENILYLHPIVSKASSSYDGKLIKKFGHSGKLFQISILDFMFECFTLQTWSEIMNAAVKSSYY